MNGSSISRVANESSRTSSALTAISSSSDDKYSSEIPEVEKIIEATVLGLISLVSGLSNLSLWVVILGTRSLRQQSAMLLLLCLSLADLLVSFFSMPITVGTIASGRWVLGEGMCTVTAFLNMVTLVSSVMSLGLISINRYVKICRPHHYNRLYTLPRMLLMSFGVWCLSAALSSPPLLGWCRYDYLPRQSFCFSDWPSSISYTFFMIVVCFGGPLSMMTFCNVRILQTYRQSQKKLQQLQQQSHSSSWQPSSSSAAEGSAGNKRPMRRRPQDVSVQVVVTPADKETTSSSVDGENVSSNSAQPPLLLDVGVGGGSEPVGDDDHAVSELTTMTGQADSSSFCSASQSEETDPADLKIGPWSDSALASSSMATTSSMMQDRQQQKKKEKRRAEEFQLALMLMVVVVVFLVCWFPFCITMFLSVFAPNALPRPPDMFTLLLGYSNSCVNPIVYGVSNKRVKQGYKSFWHQFCACCGKGGGQRFDDQHRSIT
ncbi:histamine H1 receptor-like [Babylonia areolata]|uniref:histamine H1 receptor-like n=1 Tax=Babylonia areolata TaxID=304850 RepID=UPI003FD47AC1